MMPSKIDTWMFTMASDRLSCLGGLVQLHRCPAVIGNMYFVIIGSRRGCDGMPPQSHAFIASPDLCRIILPILCTAFVAGSFIALTPQSSVTFVAVGVLLILSTGAMCAAVAVDPGIIPRGHNKLETTEAGQGHVERIRAETDRWLDKGHSSSNDTLVDGLAGGQAGVEGTTGNWRPLTLPSPVKEDSRSLPAFRRPLSRQCATCNVVRPPSSGHCRICDVCVDEHDHHCTILGCCVGRRNYRWFMIYVWSTWTASAIALVASTWFLYTSVRDTPLKSIRISIDSIEKLHFLVYFIMNYVVVLLLGMMVSSQTNAMISGVTQRGYTRNAREGSIQDVSGPAFTSSSAHSQERCCESCLCCWLLHHRAVVAARLGYVFLGREPGRSSYHASLVFRRCISTPVDHV